MRRMKALATLLVMVFISLQAAGCGGNGTEVLTFSKLISRADDYNGKTVTLEAFYFSGFEISALCGSVGPSTSGAWRIVPNGTLIWVEGGISPELQNQLYAQTDTPSGYTEHIGRLKVSGRFETSGHYGHLDAYQYQINITSAEQLEWSPPPAASGDNITAKIGRAHV